MLKDFKNHPDELFNDSKMQELVGLRVPIKTEQIVSLQAQLKRLAVEFRRIVSTTPCDLPGTPSDVTHSERLEWVDGQFLNPIDRLLEALIPENRHMLALWPNEVVDEIMPDFEAAREHLQQLKTLGQNVAATIAQHRYAKLPFGKLLRFQIVGAICDALQEYVPQFKPSRGTYDAQTKRYCNPFPEAVRLIFAEITGINEQLDHLIQEWINTQKAR